MKLLATNKRGKVKILGNSSHTKHRTWNQRAGRHLEDLEMASVLGIKIYISATWGYEWDNKKAVVPPLKLHLPNTPGQGGRECYRFLLLRWFCWDQEEGPSLGWLPLGEHQPCRDTIGPTFTKGPEDAVLPADLKIPGWYEAHHVVGLIVVIRGVMVCWVLYWDFIFVSCWESPWVSCAAIYIFLIKQNKGDLGQTNALISLLITPWCSSVALEDVMSSWFWPRQGGPIVKASRTSLDCSAFLAGPPLETGKSPLAGCHPKPGGRQVWIWLGARMECGVPPSFLLKYLERCQE